MPKSDFPFLSVIPSRAQLNDFQKVEELIHRYDAVIEDQPAAAVNRWVLNPDLSKHVNAVASLLRVKAKLQQSRAWEHDALTAELTNTLTKNPHRFIPVAESSVRFEVALSRHSGERRNPVFSARSCSQDLSVARRACREDGGGL